MQRNQINYVKVGLGLSAYSQEESKPSVGTEIVRKCSYMDIEGEKIENVTVTLKSNDPDFFFTDKYKVTVLMTDSNGKKVWKKVFKNAYLYIFSDGEIHVGKPKFARLVIFRSKYSDEYYGLVRDKEGVY